MYVIIIITFARDLVFVGDKARHHSRFINHYITQMQWPLHCPDCNPIEHVCSSKTNYQLQTFEKFANALKDLWIKNSFIP